MGRKPWSRKRLKRLHKLVLEGRTDREIAVSMGCHYNTVARERKKFGLPAVGANSVKVRQQRSKKASRQNRELLPLVARCKAAEMGWPGAGGPGQARVLDVLERGHNTAAGIAVALGYHKATIFTHLRALRRLDLVCPSGVTEYTGSVPRIVWRLADGVRRHVTDIRHRGHM